MVTPAQVRKMEKRVQRLCTVVTHAFALPHSNVEVKEMDKYHGTCSVSGKISIDVLSHDKSRLLKWDTILDTACHELAHRLEWNHNSRHKRLTISMKEWAKRHGY